ncbi:MAG TPA: 2-C-methyl-D-erythritol 4-phosphate cytidylyltransferase [Dehalococcoidia bacterium]|nr:2-C-methyl-D-erythritol 4-phosphate cytidylyltransferase [Dehalococcoidia bacterium]
MRNSQPKVSAIIAAAGESQRMNGIDKILAPLGGRPVISYVLAAFGDCQPVDRIVLVVNEKSLEACRQLIAKEGFSKPVDVCIGGKRRQDSVAAGLSKLKDCQWVVIHDGARPLVAKELIEQGLKEAQETGAAVAAVPVTDTIKTAGDDRIVLETPSRQNLWAVQTPQVFRLDIITEAYQKAKGEVTDDASLVEQAGYKVKLYMGSYDNIKITTPGDLSVAETIIKHGK